MPIDFSTIDKNTMTAYYDYMRSLSIPEKSEWTRRIVNTEMPVLAIPLPKIRTIAKEILKGDYKTFLQALDFRVYEDTITYVAVLSGIKDFDVVKRYLPKVIAVCDNWSTTDSFRPKITKDNSDKWWDYSGEFLSSPLPFARRLGIIIMFSFTTTQRLFSIFDRLNALSDENEYYVNMAGAWLLAECFIKNREETLSFYEQNSTNDFIINKSISKCRDSFRVTNEDKQFLLSFKR